MIGTLRHHSDDRRLAPATRVDHVRVRAPPRSFRRRAADTPESPPSPAWGLFLAFLGVICVSPDSMLLRSMHAVGASTPAVVSAKYFGVAYCSRWSPRSTRRKCSAHLRRRRTSSRPRYVAMSSRSASRWCYCCDDPARSLLLIALSPFWSALLGLILLGDPLPVRTRWALVFSFIAIGIVLAPRVMYLLRAPTKSWGACGIHQRLCAFDSAPHTPSLRLTKRNP